jgi:hypothetical protein
MNTEVGHPSADRVSTHPELDIMVSRADLLAAVEQATRPGCPVVVRATDDHALVHTASPDGDMLVRLLASVSAPGVAAVHPQRLTAALGACDEPYVRFARSGTVIEVSIGETSFVFPAADTEMLEAPPEPITDGVMLGADVLRAVRRVIDAMSWSERAGVKIVASAYRVRVVVRDGYRLVKCECEGPGELSVIVPITQMRAALRHAESTGEMTVAVDGGVILSTSTMIMRTRNLADEGQDHLERRLRDTPVGYPLSDVDVLHRLLIAVKHVRAVGDGPLFLRANTLPSTVCVYQICGDGSVATEHVDLWRPVSYLPEEIAVNGKSFVEMLESTLRDAECASMTVVPKRSLAFTSISDTVTFYGLLIAGES